MRISHDSFTKNANPDASTLLQLTSTPSTNVSVQLDERNGGADDGPSEILALPALENSNSEISKNSNSISNAPNSNSNQNEAQTSSRFKFQVSGIRTRMYNPNPIP